MFVTVRPIYFITLALALNACGSNSTGPVSPQPTPTATTPSAPSPTDIRIRVVNGSPGTGNVDIYLYVQGNLRPLNPTFSNVPVGGITPYVTEMAVSITMDVLRAGAVQTSAAIKSATNVTQQSFPPNVSSGNNSVVLEGVALNGSTGIDDFLEPIEQPGQSALVLHHASPAANLATGGNPIGVATYSAAQYPPGTLPAAIPASATQQLFSFSLGTGSSIATPQTPNTAGGGFIFVAPFPVAPLSSTVGFALGLPSASAAPNVPLTSVIANAALSETANENSPYAGQNSITADSTETVGPGTHLSEFLVDSDQNGNFGLIGTVDP